MGKVRNQWQGKITKTTQFKEIEQHNFERSMNQ
jgi:hypothetical protein